MSQPTLDRSALQIPNNGGGTAASSASASASPASHSPRQATSPSRAVNHGGGGIVVFSGGSAANNLVEVFENVREANQCTLSYVIPISDNGGSTSEIIRVFGGPGELQPSLSLASTFAAADRVPQA